MKESIRNKNRESAGNSSESLESVKKQNTKSSAKKHIFTFLLLAAVLVSAVWFCYDKFFVIKKCVLEYDGTLPYDETEVLKGAGLDYGMKLYEVNKDTIAENVLYNLPYVDSFELKRTWPDKIVFKIEPAVPSMYTVIGENAFVLSQSLRVLSMTDDFEYIETNKLINVKMSDIASCIAGEYLKTDSDNAATVEELFSQLEENGILSDVDEIDITDRFNITFGYKSKYLVKLGDKKNLDLKVRFMKAIEEKLTSDSGGIIDVSDENAKEGIVKDF